MSDGPILPTGHPQRHGYVQCVSCHVWRPRERLNTQGVCGAGCQPSTVPSHFDPPKEPKP